MQKIHPDFRELLEIFNWKSVRYLVIGGYAVVFHGHYRSTGDIDILLAIDAINAERVVEALRQFGFTTAAKPADFQQPNLVLAFGREPIRVDLFTSTPGLDFDDAYARRVVADVDGVEISFVSLADLRASKAACGRLKDRADLAALPPVQDES